MRDEQGTGAGCNAARTCSPEDRIFFAGAAFGSSYAGAPSSSCPRPPMKGGYFAGCPLARPACGHPAAGYPPSLRIGTALAAGSKRRSTRAARESKARRPCVTIARAQAPRLRLAEALHQALLALPARRRRGASYTLTGEPSPLGLALVSVVSRSAVVIFANGPPKATRRPRDRPLSNLLTVLQLKQRT
jgi:hypothetical protein